MRTQYRCEPYFVFHHPARKPILRSRIVMRPYLTVSKVVKSRLRPESNSTMSLLWFLDVTLHGVKPPANFVPTSIWKMAM